MLELTGEVAAIGGSWALATAITAHLVPCEHLGRALTVVNSGVALASVAAVPLGALLGAVLGNSSSTLIAAAALWGLGAGGLPTAIFTWGAGIEPARLEQIGGLIVVAMQIAIRVGAAGGGVLLDALSPRAPPRRRRRSGHERGHPLRWPSPQPQRALLPVLSFAFAAAPRPRVRARARSA